MVRWIISGLQALLIVVLLPMIIPDFQGGMLQPWKRLLLDPVKAWHFDYQLDPYRRLFQVGSRWLADNDEVVRLQVHKTKDGTLHASDSPDAPGKTVAIIDKNADLIAPTRFQGWLTFWTCWVLVLLPLHGLKHYYDMRQLPRKHKETVAELIPYTVESRVTRPLKTASTFDAEPNNELAADKALRPPSVDVLLIEETETEKELLRSKEM